MKIRSLFVARILPAALVTILAGCAAGRLHDEGLAAIAAGREEQGLRKLADAHAASPTNARFGLDYLAQREALTDKWIEMAREDGERGDLAVASNLYRRVLDVDPGNYRAAEELELLSRHDAIEQLVGGIRSALEKGDIEQASRLASDAEEKYQNDKDVAIVVDEVRKAEEARGSRALPQLSGLQEAAVSLHFTDASLRMIFEALGRSSGVNFIFDRDLRTDLRASIDVEKVSVADVVSLLLRTNQLRSKVLSDTTMLIYQDSPEKEKEYADLVVKAFYLSSSTARQAEAALKTILKVEDMFVDERLNLVVIRARPETVSLAEKLISLIDVQEPEVMLEVAVLEVQRTKLTQLGVDWPDSISVLPLGPGGKAVATIEDLKGLRPNRIGATVGSATVNIRRELTDSNLLANPRIRVKNKEKASILIGEKVPVLTSTATSTGFVSENVQYLDVGLKLNVEPTVSLRDDVAIRVSLEVSSITKQITTNSGALVYQIGTRNADTVLRLRDGETQVLAGLINDEDRASASRIPILGDVPILDRLFGSKQRSKDKTEIVLSITPHILANIEQPPASHREFWSGTATALDTRPLAFQTSVAPKAESSAQPSGDVPAETQDTSVALSWMAPSTLVAGQEASLDLKLVAKGQLMSLPLQLAFDPADFDITEVQEGGYFKQNNAPTSFRSMIDKENGKILISAARTGSVGVSGEGTLLTLKVVPRHPGILAIQVSGAAPMALPGNDATVELPPPLVLNVKSEGDG